MRSLWIIAILLVSKCYSEPQPSKDRVMDETQFSNPHSFDYNFEDDLRKPADTNDIYDEVVPFLPGFVLHKNGKDVGYTRVPIVTRKVPTWSTPRPRNRKLDIYDPWTMPPYGASTWRSQTKPPLSKLQLIHPKGLQEKLDSFHRRRITTTTRSTTLRTTTTTTKRTTTPRPTTTTRRTTTTTRPPTTTTRRTTTTTRPTTTTRRTTTTSRPTTTTTRRTTTTLRPTTTTTTRRTTTPRLTTATTRRTTTSRPTTTTTTRRTTTPRPTTTTTIRRTTTPRTTTTTRKTIAIRTTTPKPTTTTTRRTTTTRPITTTRKITTTTTKQTTTTNRPTVSTTTKATSKWPTTTIAALRAATSRTALVKVRSNELFVKSAPVREIPVKTRMGAERSAMNSAFSSPSSSVQSMSPNRKGANLLVGKTVRSISASPPLKPPIIHSGDGPYRGAHN